MLELILVSLGSHDLWPKHNQYVGKNCLTWILLLLFLLYTCRTDLTDATNRVGALQRQLRDLQGSRQNRLTLFGSWQPDLHQRIEQATRRGRFHHAPVGPIGMESLSCSARVLHSVERNNLLLVNTYLCQKPLTQKRCLHFRSIITVFCMLAYSFKAWHAQIFTSYLLTCQNCVYLLTLVIGFYLVQYHMVHFFFVILFEFVTFQVLGMLI